MFIFYVVGIRKTGAYSGHSYDYLNLVNKSIIIIIIIIIIKKILIITAMHTTITMSYI